jgi:hypothetical protein
MNERFHLGAFTESVDSATLQDATPLSDGVWNVQSDRIVIPDELPQAGLIYACGPSLTQVRLQAPSLNRLWPLDVNPIDVNATPRYPTRIFDRSGSPLRLVPDEQISIQFAEDGAGATRGTIGLWLCRGPLVPLTGEFFTIRATNASTLVANTWTNGALTLSQNLPSGRYAIVGFSARSAGLQMARLVFVGGRWRPGVVGSTAVGTDGYYLFRHGNAGIFGEFDHNNVPSVDFLSNSADSSQEVFLDLMKIG